MITVFGIRKLLVLKVLFWIFGALQLARARDGSGSRPVFIMLVGTSGSGKSEILSTLLRQNQALSVEISSIHSMFFEDLQDPEIVEYGIQSNESSIELRVIITPDFQEHGLETDARLVTTLHDYLDSHEYLNARPPDLLIICENIDDDQDSNFTKMLRSLSTLRDRLFAFSNSELENEAEEPDLVNVMFALTQNQMSNRKTVRRKIRETKYAVNEYMKIPSESIPMIIVQGQDQTQANLCSEMNNIVRNTRFDFKNAVCRSSSVQVLSKVSLVEVTHPKATKQLNTLIAMNKNVNETEISTKLQLACSRIGCSNSIESELKTIQEYFHSRHIFNVSDIPQTEYEIMSIFLGFQNTSADGLRLLDDAFELKPVEWEPTIGNGYSFVFDSILPSYPLHFEFGDSVSCVGSVLPRGVECRKQTGLNQLMKYISSQETYVIERASALNVSTNYLKLNQILENQKPGYTFLDSPTKSVYVEFLAFEVEMHHVSLSNEFLHEINTLPKLNTSSRESISAFERLFELYGSHVVSKLNYGGAIEFLLSDSWDLSTENPLKEIIQILTKKSSKSENSIQIRIHGGDSSFYSTDATAFFSDMKGKSLFTKWRNSINSKPIPLTHTPATLTPLTTILKAIGISQEKSQDVAAAEAYLIGGNYEIDGTERNLELSIQMCLVGLDEILGKVRGCESVSEKLQDNCSVQRQNCQEISRQLTSIRAEKISLLSELNTVKAAVLNKEVENSGLRLQNSESDGRISSLEASIQFTRDELRAQEGHSVKLAKLLESFGKK